MNTIDRAKTIRPDFVTTNGRINLFVEIDEYGHQGYNITCELARLDNIQQGLDDLETGSNEKSALPNILVRINPHNNKDYKESLEVRISFLLAFIESLLYATEEEKISSIALNIFYLYYNRDNIHYLAALSKHDTLVVMDTPYDSEILQDRQKKILDLISKITCDVVDERDATNSAMETLRLVCDTCENKVICIGLSSKFGPCKAYSVASTVYCFNHLRKELIKEYIF